MEVLPNSKQTIIEPLNPIYSLAIARLTDFHHRNHIDEEGNIVDTDDVSTLTNIVHIQAGILARGFGFNEINIHHRLYAIMKDISDPFEWSSGNEKLIRNKLESIGNKMSFIRPRVEVVIRALSRMITELRLSGYEILPVFIKHFIFKDVGTWLLPEHLKPSFILRLREKGSLGSKWVDNISTHKRINEPPVSIDEGWLVIGEYHIQREMEWGFPEETFQSHLKLKNANDGFHRDFIFGEVMDRLVYDYYNPDEYPDSGYLIVRNDQRFIYRTFKSSWIALNPKIAYNLNWIPFTGESFAWQDSQGKVVAKSIYWKNGNPDINHRVSNSETGEGWLVLISEEGVKQLSNYSRGWIYEKRIDRQYTSDGEIIRNHTEKIIAHKF